MRIKSSRSKCRKRDVVIKTTLSLLNVYSASLNYSNNLNFLSSLLSFNNLIRKSTI